MSQVRYFDAIVDRFDAGLEFVPGSTKWVIDCNWKFAAEQFASDMYHAPTAHVSALIALLDDPNPPNPLSDNNVPGRQFSGNGHGSGGFFLPEPVVKSTEMTDGIYSWLKSREGEMVARLGADRLSKVSFTHNTIFPNFSWLGAHSTMRVWHPRGPGQIEVWAWTYVPKDAPPKVKAEIRELTQRTFSPAGAFETDDGENWTEIQQVLRGYKARHNRFHTGMGIGHEERDSHGLPGLGNDVYSETAARGFYRRWRDLLTGKPWSEIQDSERICGADEAHHEGVTA